ncbi:10077_t:CDS:2 [Ambispora gerdemannii]|uniref:10077_t:CDS:1 n=1 Tax=Ambispora gerdemannii TaxID=144530 RepID=A0A9N9CUU3_9GLOM|nr:10077_t:CDS:2 [Ambispora gerdemannii]
MSKEVRKVLATRRATVGKVSNSEANLVRLAMNPCDHPHGGGELKAGVDHASPPSRKEGKKSAFKTRARGSVISPEMIGHTLLIYNGKSFLVDELPKTW